MRIQKRGANYEKKLWLSRYQEYREDADEWKEEADRLREQLCPSAQNLSGMPRNPSPKPVDMIWAEHIAAIGECESKMKIARENLKEILEAIEALDDSDQRRVLKHRYIRGYNWYTIAELMHRSVRNITDIHGVAINLVTLPTNANKNVR